MTSIKNIRFRTVGEWNEDDGDVLWWKLPVCEPPYAGTPFDCDFDPSYTHWTPIIVPVNHPIFDGLVTFGTMIDGGIKHKRRFTQEEKDFLMAFKALGLRDYYIARDKCGVVAAYCEKPHKNQESEVWERGAHDMMMKFYVKAPDGLASWEDEQPFSVKQALAELEDADV